MMTVLKLGGELLDDAATLTAVARAVRDLAAREQVIVVHGGGRAIDAELRQRGLKPRFVDGLRVTDTATLDAVVSVLAGLTNTRLVGALHAAGVRAVGLTGADAGIGLSERAPLFTSAAGTRVDLGLVGQPVDGPVRLLQDLSALRYVPVVASIGVTADGTLLNVNADTLASHLASTLLASRLIIAGATAGVLDKQGDPIPALTPEDVDRMIAGGDAHSGMIAKLQACRTASARGVEDVAIVSGKGAVDFNGVGGTRMVRALGAR